MSDAPRQLRSATATAAMLEAAGLKAMAEAVPLNGAA
jgi:hypothetical protein